MTTTEIAAIEAHLEGLGRKIDALHRELRDDIQEIKADSLRTSQEVSSLKIENAKVKGALAAITLGLPFAVFALEQILSK